ncbi:MAG: fimbrillin family protein [Phocaeicola sp.]
MRFPIYTLLSLLLLSSCQNELIHEEASTLHPIGFTSATHEFATRSVETDLSVMQNDGNGFGVFAFYTPTSWESDGDALSPNLLNGVSVKYSAGSGWNYDNPKFWPLTGRTSFFAYYPYSLVEANYTQTGVPSFSYSVANEALEQVDIVAASQIDATREGTGGKVNLPFKHLLSKIGFTARTVDDYSGKSFVITRMQLKYKENSVLKNGTFTYHTDGSSIGDWSPAATPVYHSGSTELMTNPVSIQMNSELTPLNDADRFLFLVPQNLHADDLTLQIAYTLDGVDYEKTLAIFPGASNYALQLGKKHTINLSISLDDILFDDITVGDYTEEDLIKIVYKNRRTEGPTDAHFYTVGTHKVYDGLSATVRTEKDLAPFDLHFYGWSTDPNAGWDEVEYKPGDSIKPISNTILYAIWTSDYMDQTVLIENVGIKGRWATGNLTNLGASECRIGKPTEDGLFFQYHSLLGRDTTSVVVKPAEYSGSTTWNSDWRNAEATYEPASAKGDPCTHYLGKSWRLPTTMEILALFSLSETTAGHVPWNTLQDWSFVESNKPYWAFYTDNKLSLPALGWIKEETGKVVFAGEYGEYHTSAAHGDDSSVAIDFRHLGMATFGASQARGMNVRCIFPR